MKTYKLYIRFILFISFSLLLNQPAFSSLDSFSVKQDSVMDKSSQKENLQKRLRQQRNKLNVLNKKHSYKKVQRKNGIGAKGILVIFLILLAVIGAVLVTSLQSLLIIGIGILLFLIGIAGLWIILF